MINLKNIRLPLKFTSDELYSLTSKAIKIPVGDIKDVSVKRLSIDARKKTDVHYSATLCVHIDGNEKRIAARCKNADIDADVKYSFESTKALNQRPVIVGAGPAGLFSGLLLARNGAQPIIIERGECVEKRTKSIDLFWNTGMLNKNSNVQFGEGGAGTFSDGKLNTGINDIRSRFVLEEFVKHGAPRDILVNAKPHIGTDELKKTIINIRKEIESLGGTFMFNTLATDLIIKDERIQGICILHNNTKERIYTDNLIFAIGHSARDTFEMLKSRGISMQQKAFSIGVRIEHLREDIDECQYGKACHILGAADYKINTHLKDGRGVYSFCMCPGGYVVNASSEEGMLCTNGMSYHARNGKNSNSAILVSVTPQDYNQNDVLDGIRLQRKIERKAYNAIGGYIAPVQRVGNFLGKNRSVSNKIEPTILPGYEYYDIGKILPDFISESLKEGLINISERMSAFKDMDAVITASETRSSSPVRILRNEAFECVNCKGLYPCGEGAGYAGGIMSAAVDGIKCAEAILKP